jgi:hypothetical protein
MSWVWAVASVALGPCWANSRRIDRPSVTIGSDTAVQGEHSTEWLGSHHRLDWLRPLLVLSVSHRQGS